jgi:hypothetical protein
MPPPLVATGERHTARSEVVPEDAWTSVVAYSDRISATAVLGLLAGHEMPCYIASNEHVPGLGSHFSVCVPTRLLHRARWILEQARVSESELTELAMRTPPEGSADN